MKKTSIRINQKTRGGVEVVDMAPNGSWITIEFTEYSRTGWAKASHRVTIDVFDATEIARKTHEALSRQRTHQDRLELRAKGEGF